MIQMWQPIALLLQQSIQSCIIYQKCNYRKYRPHIKLQINIISIFLKQCTVRIFELHTHLTVLSFISQVGTISTSKCSTLHLYKMPRQGRNWMISGGIKIMDLSRCKIPDTVELAHCKLSSEIQWKNLFPIFIITLLKYSCQWMTYPVDFQMTLWHQEYFNSTFCY